MNEETSLAYASIRRQVRVLALLDAARCAGLVPLPVLQFHIVAYLADVLSPVWNLRPMEAKVWKTTGGPFYPDLQRDVDLLVGKGMIEVSDIGHVETHDEGFRISCSYAINSDFAGPVLSLLETLPDEQEMLEFCQELMLALSGMSDEQIEAAFRQDATYSYRRTGPQNVIEFDLEGRNFSAIAAEKIGELLPTHAKAGPGEKVHLYMRHLRTRLAGGR